MSAQQRPGFAVLFVCTGNICRSPLAERLGRTYVDPALAGSPGGVRLGSAGTRADVGSGMHPLSATVLRSLGGDPDGFHARRLTDEQVRSADLVLAMTREHRSAVLALAPRAMARTFTLLEAADLVRIIGDVEPADGSAPRAPALVAQLAAARARRSGGAHDDVPDPIGGSLEVHREVGATIAEALDVVLRRVVSPRDADLPR